MWPCFSYLFYLRSWALLGSFPGSHPNAHDIHSSFSLPVEFGCICVRADKGNVCDDVSKSGCTHLCLVLPARHSGGNGERGSRSNGTNEVEDLYYCACPPEYALDSDGKTCIVPDSMLLYSLDGTGIRRMSLPKSRLRPRHAHSRTPLKHQPPNDRSASKFIFIFLLPLWHLKAVEYSHHFTSLHHLWVFFHVWRGSY